MEPRFLLGHKTQALSLYLRAEALSDQSSDLDRRTRQKEGGYAILYTILYILYHMLYIYIDVHIYIYVYMYICIYIYVYIYVYIYDLLDILCHTKVDARHCRSVPFCVV